MTLAFIFVEHNTHLKVSVRSLLVCRHGIDMSFSSRIWGVRNKLIQCVKSARTNTVINMLKYRCHNKHDYIFVFTKIENTISNCLLFFLYVPLYFKVVALVIRKTVITLCSRLGSFGRLLLLYTFLLYNPGCVMFHYLTSHLFYGCN